LVEGLSSTFDSLQTNRTNDIMRLLTIFNAVLLPLTVVTGLFGMNIDFPFITNVTAFWCVIGAMVIITFTLILVFNRQTRR
jgi:Mg2+ and Co2+ transporter CorA